MGEMNCDVVQVEITNITNSPMAELTAELTTDGKTPSTPTTAVTSFTVSIPFIVNTEAIAVGKELVVKTEKKPEEKRLRQKGKSSLHSPRNLPAATRIKRTSKETLRRGDSALDGNSFRVWSVSPR